MTLALEIKNYEQIFTELKLFILGEQGPLTDFTEGSGLYVLTRAYASALAAGYGNLDQALRLSFIALTEDEAALDAHLLSFGLTRKQGTLSSGNLIAFPLTGPAAVTTLNPGTRFKSTDDRFHYIVTQTTVLDAPYTLVPIRAVAVGSGYDLPPGTELVEVTPVLTNTWSFVVGTDGLDGLGRPKGFLRGGSNRETNDEYRARFVDFLNSLSKSTFLAVRAAVQSIPDLESYVLVEYRPAVGWFTLYVDDGTDTPPQTLIDVAKQTLDKDKALGIAYKVLPMTKRLVDLDLTLRIDLTQVTDTAALQDDVRQRLTKLLAGYQFGQALYLSRVIEEVHQVPGILQVVVNAPLTDVLPNVEEAVRLGSIDMTLVV